MGSPEIELYWRPFLDVERMARAIFAEISSKVEAVPQTAAHNNSLNAFTSIPVFLQPSRTS
jgi:hypothetical protein